VAPRGSLAGQVAVVTGGAAGIGGGVSRALAASGAIVVINDIDAELLALATTDIEQAGGVAVPVRGDITDANTVRSLAAAVRATGDGVADVLVNNVGDYRPWASGFLGSDESQWHDLYAVNLEHVFRVSHALLPDMVAARSGSIVNVSTVEAYRGIPSNAVYSAFNAGIVAFTRSLAVELAPAGIRVNAIAPDLADTLQTPAASMLRGRDPALVKSWVPLGRFGSPDDYAQVVLFLATDASRFVTGHTIPVDGGTLAASGWYRRTDGKGWTNLPDQV
jgi:2-hydroxycyclohexanecarboxyl-CoA dehydrogenase